jgi:hypothetical protein
MPPCFLLRFNGSDSVFIRYHFIILKNEKEGKAPLVPDSLLFVPDGLRKTASPVVSSSSLVARTVPFQA